MLSCAGGKRATAELSNGCQIFHWSNQFTWPRLMSAEWRGIIFLKKWWGNNWEQWCNLPQCYIVWSALRDFIHLVYRTQSHVSTWPNKQHKWVKRMRCKEMGSICLADYFIPGPKPHLWVSGKLSSRTPINSQLCKFSKFNTYLFTWEWTDFVHWPTLSIPTRELLIIQDINLKSIDQ